MLKNIKEPKDSSEEEPHPPIQILIDRLNLPVAGIKALSNSICLANVLNDGNYRLVCADIQKNLKVFKGNLLQNEGKLQMIPVGVVSYYAKDKSSNIMPFLAVAGGTYIFIYKNLKGTVKFPIKNDDINYDEAEIYNDYRQDLIDERRALEKMKELNNRLNNLRSNPNYYDNENNEEGENKKSDDSKNEIDEELRRLPLTQATVELLSMKSENKQLEFLKNNKYNEFIVNNYITCINTMKQYSEDEDSPSYLVIGTETGNILIISPSESKTLSTIKLPETPFILETKGVYDGKHKIIVADRGYNIYILGSKNEIKRKILVGQNIISLKYYPKNIYLCTTGRNYMSYTNHCDKRFSLGLSNNILGMELYKRKKESICITLISVKCNQVRLYKEKDLFYIIKTKENIFDMKIGKFEEQEDSLILLGYSGSLLIKYFNQDVNFEDLVYEEDENKEEIKLNIPKKTQVYVELIEREKECCEEMQNIFQRDLLKLRYRAMDTYSKMLKTGNVPQNYSTSSKLKISVSLQGLGPQFKLNLVLDNSGKEPIYNAELTLDYNRAIFNFEKENIALGLIMPNIPIKYSIAFTNISENGSAGNVKIIVVDKMQTVPLIQTNVKVPVSELEIL